MFVENKNNKNYKLAAAISLAVLALIILFGLSSILSVFLGAIIFYVLSKPLMLFLVEKWKWNKTVSAIIIMILGFVLILGPTIAISNLFYNKVMFLMGDVSLTQRLTQVDLYIKEYLGIELFSDKNIQEVQKEVTGFFAGFISESLSLLGNIAIMYFMLFYMLVNAGKIEKLVATFIPLSTENLEVLGKELESQIYSNAIGAPILALIQGILASIGYYIFDVPDPLFWGMITGAFSLIPVIGSAAIWFPASIFKFMIDDTFNGVGLLLLGVLVISTADNLFRFVIQKKLADIHPLITILGLIAGLKLFGFSGLIFGPLMLSYFVILLRMYRKSYHIEP
jgi:predicted PurR-regulated permease PerM